VTTFERVRKVIVDQLGVDLELVRPDAGIYDDLGADPAEVELVMALEEEFDFEIPDEDAERILSTVDTVVRYIDEKSGG
jgi:acyl carrier protein